LFIVFRKSEKLFNAFLDGCLKMEFPQSKLIHQFTIALLRRREDGFTLLELMVVMIIISVLSAIAIPAFYGQIGKSREAELQMKIGSLARSQQAYHYELGQFAPTINTLNMSDGLITSNYYTFLDPALGDIDATKVKHQGSISLMQ
jgi:prepilin-type N-terminal cleavage/methylation domain-containing protein